MPPSDPIPLAELHQFELLQHVRTAALERIRAHATQRKLARGEALLIAHRPNDTLYLVRSGSFGVHLTHLEGPSIAIIGRGESIGELSLLHQKPTSAHVIAREPSVVLGLPEAEFWALLERSHSFAVNLLLKLGDRLRSQNQAISAHIRQREEASELAASFDPLTQVHHRGWLEASLPRWVAKHADTGQPLSLVLADIDHFKAYNDAHGHRVGDAVLRATATSLRKGLRQTDRIARYGGEEFVILLPETTLEPALATAERLREAVAHISLPGYGMGIPPPVTVSMGVAQLEPDQDADALIEAADRALYRAKASGRNVVRDPG